MDNVRGAIAWQLMPTITVCFLFCFCLQKYIFEYYANLGMARGKNNNWQCMCSIRDAGGSTQTAVVVATMSAQKKHRNEVAYH